MRARRDVRCRGSDGHVVVWKLDDVVFGLIGFRGGVCRQRPLQHVDAGDAVEITLLELLAEARQRAQQPNQLGMVQCLRRRTAAWQGPVRAAGAEPHEGPCRRQRAITRGSHPNDIDLHRSAHAWGAFIWRFSTWVE